LEGSIGRLSDANDGVWVLRLAPFLGTALTVASDTITQATRDLIRGLGRVRPAVR
jgi:hypothetical protein